MWVCCLGSITLYSNMTSFYGLGSNTLSFTIIGDSIQEELALFLSIFYIFLCKQKLATFYPAYNTFISMTSS